jgi:hypothetical protein
MVRNIGPVGPIHQPSFGDSPIVQAIRDLDNSTNGVVNVVSNKDWNPTVAKKYLAQIQPDLAVLSAYSGKDASAIHSIVDNLQDLYKGLEDCSPDDAINRFFPTFDEYLNPKLGTITGDVECLGQIPVDT